MKTILVTLMLLFLLTVTAWAAMTCTTVCDENGTCTTVCTGGWQ